MLNQVVLVGRISSINKETMNRDDKNKRFTTIVIATPRSFKNEINASPVPSSRMAVSVLIFGLTRNALAAALTVFCSAGVYARSAC